MVSIKELYYDARPTKSQEFHRSVVNLLMTLANDQLDAQILNTFITILYMYMFRSISCSSSGGQIVLTFKSLLVTCCTTSLTFNNCTLCPHCIYVFCIYQRTNSDLCQLQHKLIGFYNRDEKCLQRGTDWAFK